MNVALARTDARRLALAYLELTKPRIVFLVLLTGIPALLLAAGGLPPPRAFVAAVLGTALAAASAAAFNHYFDRDLDRLMVRTRNRPLPAGTIPPAHALAFAFVLAGLSWLVLAGLANVLAAAIALASIFYYAIVYTVWLKRTTPQNIVIGGGAGASAPLIAWAAVTGTVGLPAVLLAAIVFFWTPPHFWALSLYSREDYKRAGIPMLPVTHGEDKTRRQITLYTICLVPVTLAPAAIGVAGPVYWVPALILGVLFAVLAWRLMTTAETARAVRLFRFSILYLFLLFVFLGVDAGLGGPGRLDRARVAGSAPAPSPAASADPAVSALAGPTLVVTFAVRTAGNLPVTAEPLVPEVNVRRGDAAKVEYRFTNRSARTVQFQAIHRITPAEFDSLFRKEVCFCFERQSLGPSETAVMPVRFELDPRLPLTAGRIALDYTLVELPSSSAADGLPPGMKSHVAEPGGR
ncbi:MAG: heme o synthase [Candidatus Eiseniibacteriota bacterium]